MTIHTIRNTMRGLPALAALFLLFGCGSQQISGAQYSGFLGDYSQLRPGGEGRALMMYVNPDIDLAKYRKIILDPVVVLHTPDAEAKITNAQMRELANYMYDALRKALSPAYQFVNQPGPDVMRMRVAVTDVVPGKPVMGTISTVLPVGLAVSGGAKLITGSHTGVAKTGVEMELVDSQTGLRAAAAVDRRAGSKRPFEGSLDGIKENMDHWAQQIAARLDEVRGQR